MRIGDLVKVKDVALGIDSTGVILDIFTTSDGFDQFEIAYTDMSGFTDIAWFADLHLVIVDKDY